jgi:hypothetical protein
MLKKILRSLIESIFTEALKPIKLDLYNKIKELEEDLDRVEKNAERRYYEMKRVDIKLQELDQ